MDNYEAMKPWEHGKIVEIHPDILCILSFMKTKIFMSVEYQVLQK